MTEDVPSKRRKLNFGHGFLNDVSQTEVLVIPVLPDSVTAPVPLVSVYAAAVLEKRKTSALLIQLARLFPLDGLSHLKRVRKVQKKDGKQERDELQIILCEVNVKESRGKGPVFLEDIFKDSALIDLELLGMPFEARVAVAPPQTRAQYEEARHHWPTAFHEDKELTKLISGDLFTQADKARIKEHMHAALDASLKSWGSDRMGEAIGGIVVDPVTDKMVVTASHHGDSLGHPLQHTVMKCIDLVAHSQGGGAWPISPGDAHFQPTEDQEEACPDTSYLCTGYDLYVTQEPCIMCAMALVHSRIRRVFYLHGCPDGALGSHYKLHAEAGINHRYQVFKVELANQVDGLDHR